MTTRLSDAGRIRGGLAAGAILLAMTGTLAGCSSDGGGDEPIEGAETESESESPDETSGEENGEDDEADVNALEDLYLEYWDAVIQLENGEDLDLALFDGIATGGVAEDEVGRVRPFKEEGIHREGEPSIDNVNVSVDGDTARIESCKSEAGWAFVQNGEEVPELLPEQATQAHTYVVSATRSSGDWLINGTLLAEEATITC